MSEQYIRDALIDFLNASPTPYHATAQIAQMLVDKGFSELKEDEFWDLTLGQRYYFVRSDSTIVGFVWGLDNSVSKGIRLVGAHTDSPCIKLKPQPEKNIKGYQQLGIEVYGGALLNPWFDRDLSLAGKVCFLRDSGELTCTCINYRDPIAVIPSLAIHLDREANKKRSINPQTDMNPILFQGSNDFSLRTMLLEKLHEDGISDAKEVLDFDLSFYDTQGANTIGLHQEFLASARLDNLLSSFVGMHALANADNQYTSIMVCNDHEEVGSQSDIGALGTVVKDLLARLYPQEQERQVAIRRSLMLSVDNAHGIHPNYVNRHDENHGPQLNAGPVLKFDANQSYATSSHSAAFVKQLASMEPKVPVQTYVTRADMRCGSTIGPLTSSQIGIKTLDLGVATFAMHSIRELAGKDDINYLHRLLSRFYNAEKVAISG
ncbi:M18 family aminopeptidase [Agarilytica rhodophyticola]|uniref:M18 family aminopeptidase n=1 Tax=Agarilytica rhodophyticola TaxID=1737490 RepID=UPI000B346369|nr:M18 family aminopeptidase [Agarilytica rhodophyticola]